MSYQIPKDLTYEEKIIFNLTLKQLFYALIFSFFIVTAIKKISNVKLLLFFIILNIVLAVLFMFFNLGQTVKSIIFWQKNRVVNLTQRNDVLTLKIEPINFNLFAEQDKTVVLKAFEKFLNHLDFNIQILVKTDEYNLNKYFESIKKSPFYSEHKNHVKGVIEKNNVLNKSFYIIIENKGDTKLKIEIIEKKLSVMGLKTELVNNLVSKCKIKNNFNHAVVDEKFVKVISICGFPRTVNPGFIDSILSLKGNFDVSIHIKPYSLETTLVKLNKELEKERSDLYSLSKKNILNLSLEIQYNDTRQILEEIQKGEQKLFDVSFYIKAEADTIESLNLTIKQIKSELNSLIFESSDLMFCQYQSLLSCLPIISDKENRTRNITTKPLSAFFMFTSKFYSVEDNGVFFGLNKNNLPVIKDIFSLPNHNGLIIAQSGGGKSYFAKLFLLRHIAKGTKVLIIDPQGEYKELVKINSGEIIEISRDSKTIINPLDLMTHDYSEKRLSLIDLMQVMLGELTEPQKAFIDRAISEAYLRKGITNNEKTWHYSPPTLGDVYSALVYLEKKALIIEKAVIHSLMNRLSMYTEGVFSFLNNHTNINFDNNIVSFDLGKMPKQIKPAMMFLVLDYIYMKMKNSKEKKILLIDEAWSLLSRTEDASYIFEIVKTCRKFNMGLLLINQETEELLDSSVGKSILANSAYTLLLRQKQAVIDKVCETFSISKSVRNILLTSSVGEGVLIFENEQTELKIIASDEEDRVISTKPQEEKNSVTQSKRKVNITLDIDKNYFLIDSLNNDEISFLKAKGYKEYQEYSYFYKKSVKVLQKQSFNESNMHCFYVHDILEYLKKKGVSAECFVTRNPDITFNLNNKKHAFEVETGKNILYSKKMLNARVCELNKNYDEWCFILLDEKYLDEYKKLGKTVLIKDVKQYIDEEML